MDDDANAVMRARAIALADSGNFNHWEEIGARMRSEGFSSIMTMIETDAALRISLNARCALARSADH